MNEIEEKLGRVMPEIARRIQNELMLVCPVDTGRLRNSIKVKTYEEGIIIWMAEYGKFVEFGTPPHTINPNSKKALKFKVGKRGNKKEIFAKVVHHPGSRPQPFIRNTIQNKLRNIIIEELSR
jgi:HK97 gp10 family phage protein